MERMECVVTTLPTIPPNIEASLIAKNVTTPTIQILLYHRMEHLLKDVQVLIHLSPQQPPQVELEHHIWIGGMRSLDTRN